MESFRPALLERLEPRILLSGDGLFSLAGPDLLYNPLLEGPQQVVERSTLTDTNEHIELTFLTEDRETHQESELSETLEPDLFPPLLTLSVSDEGVASIPTAEDNEPSQDSTEKLPDKRTLMQVAELPVGNEVVKSQVFEVEDDYTPTDTNEADLSAEYATSIEIRGPPADAEEFSTALYEGTYTESVTASTLSRLLM